MIGPTNLSCRVLTCLLYTRCKWITRHPRGVVTVTLRETARSIRSKPESMRDALDRLRDSGLISWYQYHGTYAVVKLRAPEEAAWVAGDEELLTLYEKDGTWQLRPKG